MSENVWLRKMLVLASIALFVGAGVIPSIGSLEKKYSEQSNLNTDNISFDE